MLLIKTSHISYGNVYISEAAEREGLGDYSPLPPLLFFPTELFSSKLLHLSTSPHTSVIHTKTHPHLPPPSLSNVFRGTCVFVDQITYSRAEAGHSSQEKKPLTLRVLQQATVRTCNNHSKKTPVWIGNVSRCTGPVRITSAREVKITILEPPRDLLASWKMLADLFEGKKLPK